MPFSIRASFRLPVQSLVTIAILYLMHTPVHAGLCMRPVVQKDSPYLRGTSRHLDCRLWLRNEPTTESAEPPHT